jgi:hypothetical protein
LIGLAGVFALAFAFVSSNVAANHHPKPHDLPVAIVGSAQAADAFARQLDSKVPGGFEVKPYGSEAAARTAILHRKVYGAFEPGPPPTLLVASAASRSAETLLEQTFEQVARAQGQTLVVRDLAPLPSSDSTGATSFAAVLSLIIAGVLGSSIMYMVTQGRPLGVRLASLLALGVGAGLMAALATNIVVGAFSGHFLAVWGVASLFVLALAFPIAAFQVILGIRGTAVGLLVFLVIGNPASGGSTAPELLPGFWRAVSQVLPPGAATTSMRDVVYFHGHGTRNALVVLAIYAIVGAAATIILYRVRRPHDIGATA